MSRNNSSRLARCAVLAILLCAGMCGRHNSGGGRRYPPLLPETREVLELAFHDEARYFRVDLSVPRGYQRQVLHQGEVWWSRDRDPLIQLVVNPSKNLEFFDRFRACKYPDLEIPLIDGTQVACFGASYQVVREIVVGDDVLRCSIVSDQRDRERLGEAWALCAEMRVRFETPTLKPAEREAFALVNRGAIYDVEIELPYRYRTYFDSEPARARSYARGRVEPIVHVQLDEHLRIRKDYNLDWSTQPCLEMTGRALQWRRESPTEIAAFCRYEKGPNHEDAHEVVRLVKVGQGVLSCTIRDPGHDTSAEELLPICDSMKVTRRFITW
jgi:hypothetical protein